MKKVTKKSENHTVDAWVVNNAVAARIPNSDLDKIQRRFKGGLEIAKTRTGGIAVYAGTPGSTSADFEQFMEVYTPFEKQRLDIRRI
jgi:hypothetical protein